MDLRRPALRVLEFLERDFGFSPSLESSTLVTYVTNDVQVDVRLEAHRSFELGIGIRLRDEVSGRSAEPMFDLGEVLATAHAPDAQRYQCVQVTSQPALDRCLEEMAKLLLQYGSDLLRGEPTAFRALSEHRDIECQRYRDDVELSRARSIAADAWQKRDYGAVIEALSSVRGELLSESDRKRLEIAKYKRGPAS